MQEILFKGKDKVDGRWITGFLVSPKHIGDWVTAHPIDPETVGQFTGWVFNGVKAFQGDIVKSAFGIGVIRFGEYRVELDLGDCEIDDHAETWIDSIGFYIEYTSGEQTVPDYDWMDYFTVIGNIHDNPELLGAER